MADKKEGLKKTIAEFKEKLAKQMAASPDAKKNLEARKTRKQLKRAQRRLSGLATPTLDERLKTTQKHLDIIGKLLTELTKGAKKVQGNPHAHSLRKKSKSLNKRVKKLNRLIEKQKKATPAAAPTA